MVWIGLGPAPEGDTTMPEVTFEYLTRDSLVRAINDGSAFNGGDASE
jgi:hypothetical protein